MTPDTPRWLLFESCADVTTLRDVRTDIRTSVVVPGARIGLLADQRIYGGNSKISE